MLNVVLIGCGRIGKRHAELLSTGQIDGMRLTAVCDIIPTRAQEFGEKYNVPHFTSYSEMLVKTPGVDVVSLCIPSGLHYQHALAIAKLEYTKHLIVEKPITLTLPEADDLIQACAVRGIKLYVVKQNRFNLPVQVAHKALWQERFGKLLLGAIRVRWCRHQQYYNDWHGTWELAGGVLANQAIHHIDLMQWFFGPVESVFAKASTFLVQSDVEDTLVATVQFQSGALGTIECTTCARPKDTEGSFSILGEKGLVELGGFAVNEIKTWQFENTTPDDATVAERYSQNPPNVYGFGHKAYYEHVCDCITHGLPHMVDGIEARKSLEIVTALYESVETNREVYLGYPSSRLGK